MTGLHCLHGAVFGAVCASLDNADLRALKACSTELRDAVRVVQCARGVIVTDPRDLRAPWMADLTRLTIVGVPAGERRQSTKSVFKWKPRFKTSTPLAELPALPRLRSLSLHHPTLVDPRFWHVVLERCPALERVQVIGEFFIENSEEDAAHCETLVRCGAGRLKHLDVQGCSATWNAVRPRGCVPSNTLQYYRAACPAAGVGVDCEVLRRLVVEESATEGVPAAALSLRQMGPRTHRACTDLTWAASWDTFDPRVVSPFASLESVSMRVMRVCNETRLSKQLRELRCLPRSLRQLDLRLETWRLHMEMFAPEWPADALKHLSHLERLDVSATFPPHTLPDLLGHWMGAAPAEACARFDEDPGEAYEDEMDRMAEEGAASDDEDMDELRDMWLLAVRRVPEGPLLRWLDDHPGSHVRLCNTRVMATHPRLSLG